MLVNVPAGFRMLFSEQFQSFYFARLFRMVKMSPIIMDTTENLIVYNSFSSLVRSKLFPLFMILQIEE